MTRFIIKRSEKKVRVMADKKNKTSGDDITVCEGGKCPFREKCKRYTARREDMGQSYFTKPPFKINKGKPSCEMFWGDAAQELFIMLKEITEGEKKKKQR